MSCMVRKMMHHLLALFGYQGFPAGGANASAFQATFHIFNLNRNTIFDRNS